MNKPKQYHLKCPICSETMQLKASRHGWFYGCSGWPGCDCTHSCHQEGDNAGKPLGKPADNATRKARRKAHIVFDRIWKETPMKRKSAYEWLTKSMNTTKECHIGNMNTEQCKEIIQHAEKKLASLEHKETK